MSSMVHQVMTMIMAGGRGERLFPLTRDVAKPAVTFGGSYRMIDFTLSNCLNSGIRRVYLLTQYSNLTMNRHVRQAWDLLFRNDFDEFLESLPPQHRSVEDWYHGTADSIYQNIHILQKHRPEHVLILSGDHVYKMNYVEMIESHVRSGADLSIAGVETERSRAKDFGVMEVDGENRVHRFVEKPGDPPSIPEKPGRSLVSMGIYVFSTVKLVRELIRDAKDPNSGHDFGKDIIPSLIARGDRVHVFPFRDANSGASIYWRDIGTLDSYFACNLDLVAPQPEMDLCDRKWPVRTYARPYPPARIVDSTVDTARKGEVLRSLISQGCVISGGRVEGSVLSPDVRIHTGAHVSESILMEGVDVGRGAALRRTIVSPHVRIPEGTRVGYDDLDDRRRFMVTEQGVTVIPEEYPW
jgi:glucose-1-phosphate adenylyltransferase